jgi:p-hydroxybenzoate 3-monooxygenase
VRVLIVGAGPAGLVLANLLRAAEIDCLVVERQSRAHVEQRARAGFLAENSVRILDAAGLAEGLHENGQRHGACAFRTDDGEFELAYSQLGRGEGHTVYPQQDLVRDLIASLLDRGGSIRFDTPVDGIHDVTTDRPWVGAAGERLTGRFVAGCDGQYGVARPAVAGTTTRLDHGASWLALLAEAPPSLPTVTYAIHPNGFAGHMARTPTVTRYYLQCPPDGDPLGWSEERIWSELATRMRADRYGSLVRGRIIERRIVEMRSYVTEPMQRGNLFLVGDAGSMVSPAAAKGANLAIMSASLLATALTEAIRHEDHRLLDGYSAACLPMIWRAQEFSHWMLSVLNTPTGPDAAFLRALQRARLASLRTSRRHQDHFAENYIGVTA